MRIEFELRVNSALDHTVSLVESTFYILNKYTLNYAINLIRMENSMKEIMF